eukprot:CAMPEP_0182865052 /NCGR_PEP_ID=MMETSP0034_2-20130328/7488_1 /TAXON_ID=156128 /ORGANISM="Nephroselmis pyriformis, Strain CCMP717" /LENGTH=771 /DNA_ID=CAMNT_0024997337 /DNA_START=124 /DNA_END=2436 /DNA_ORIENTATION=-
MAGKEMLYRVEGEDGADEDGDGERMPSLETPKHDDKLAYAGGPRNQVVPLGLTVAANGSEVTEQQIGAVDSSPSQAKVSEFKDNDSLGSPTPPQPPGDKSPDRLGKMGQAASLSFASVAGSEHGDDVRDRRPSGGARLMEDNTGYFAHAYIINPRGKFMKNWELIIAALVAFTAVVTPFEVAFILVPALNGLFFMNRVVDFGFICDMAITFNASYWDENRRRWIYSKKAIAANYLRGWFFLDLITVLPFDAIGVGSDDSEISRLKIVRGLRLLRLFKLLRMLRGLRIFGRLETSFDIDYAHMELFSFVMLTVMCGHWLACMWSILAITTQDIEPEWQTWYDVAFAGWDWRRAECVVGGSEHGSQACAEDFDPLEHVPVFERYAAALFFAVGQMTAGLGDIVPQNTVERVAAVISMVFGAILMGYIIGAVSALMSSRNQRRNRFFQLMKDLNSFMKDCAFPHPVRVRLREYFRNLHISDSVSSYYHPLLQHMSPALKGEIALLMDNAWIINVKMFRNMPQDFIMQVALLLKRQTYPALEAVCKIGTPNETMYIIKKGTVAANGIVLCSGGVICSEVLYTPGLIHTQAFHTLTFTVLYTLERADLVDLLKQFPHVDKKLRLYAVRETFRTEVFAFCNAVRKVQGLEPVRRRVGLFRFGQDAREAHYTEKVTKDNLLDGNKALSLGSFLSVKAAGMKWRRHSNMRGSEEEFDLTMGGAMDEQPHTHTNAKSMRRRRALLAREREAAGESAAGGSASVSPDRRVARGSDQPPRAE